MMKGGKMEENYAFHEVQKAADQMTALGALMMALDGNVTDLTEDEIHGVGILLNSIGMELREWNKEKEKDDQKENADIKKKFRHYMELKKQTEGAILLPHSEGDSFYRFWFDDAYFVNQLMNLPLNMAHGGIPQCVIRMDEKDNCIGIVTGISMTAAVCEEVKDQKASEINKPIYATVLTPEAGNVAAAVH